jgi:hypothetical protein
MPGQAAGPINGTPQALGNFEAGRGQLTKLAGGEYLMVGQDGEQAPVPRRQPSQQVQDIRPTRDRLRRPAPSTDRVGHTTQQTAPHGDGHRRVGNPSPPIHGDSPVKAGMSCPTLDGAVSRPTCRLWNLPRPPCKGLLVQRSLAYFFLTDFAGASAIRRTLGEGCRPVVALRLTKVRAASFWAPVT